MSLVEALWPVLFWESAQICLAVCLPDNLSHSSASSVPSLVAMAAVESAAPIHHRCVLSVRRPLSFGYQGWSMCFCVFRCLESGAFWSKIPIKVNSTELHISGWIWQPLEKVIMSWTETYELNFAVELLGSQTYFCGRAAWIITNSAFRGESEADCVPIFIHPLASPNGFGGWANVFASEMMFSCRLPNTEI